MTPLVYHSRPLTVEDLKVDISAAAVTPQTLNRVQCSLQHRFKHCEQHEEHQLDNLLP